VVELGVTQNYPHLLLSHLSCLFRWHLQTLFRVTPDSRHVNARCINVLY